MSPPLRPNRTPLCVTRPDGTREWRLGAKFHREDGPARVWPDGTREWLVQGKRHREDGPAIEWPDGTREWWVHDQRHREDGPAIERPDGTREWWLRKREIPWALPAALFVVREAREDLETIADPAAQREAALRWASRLSREVWQQVCAEALADPHDAELRQWGLRALGSQTLAPAEPSATSIAAPSADVPSPRQRR